MVNPTTKCCTKCKLVKPVSQFYFNTSKQRHEAWCKQCTKESVLNSRRKNPEAHRRANRRDYKKHRVKKLEVQRQRYWEDPAWARFVQNEWARKHPSEMAVKYNARRARQVNAEGAFTRADIKRQREKQHNRCYYCGNEGKLTVDHVIPLARGGTNWPDNLVLACPHCNSSKGNKRVDDWLKRR